MVLPDGRRAGLEFLDFDDAETRERFVQQLITRGGRALLERLPCEETPTGGRHYGYLCVASGASTTLARRSGEDPKRRGFPPRAPVSLHAGKQVRAYALTCFPSKQGLGEEFLRGLFQRPATALACAAALGLPADRVRQRFLCILPGHAEVHPSASLHWDPKTGALQYHDWHARDGEPWYTLPDVRASLASRQAVRLRGPSVATWQLRLLVEAGILAPYPVPSRPLPSDVPPAVRTVYNGFLFLLACKWWHTPHAPAPFAWRFAAAWCGLGARQAGKAMRWLLAHGWLRPVGTYRRTALFVPGAGPGRRRVGGAR